MSNKNIRREVAFRGKTTSGGEIVIRIETTGYIKTSRPNLEDWLAQWHEMTETYGLQMTSSSEHTY